MSTLDTNAVKWEIIPEGDTERRYGPADTGLKVRASASGGNSFMILKAGYGGCLAVTHIVHRAALNSAHMMAVSLDNLPRVVQEALGCDVPADVQSVFRKALLGAGV